MIHKLHHFIGELAVQNVQSVVDVRLHDLSLQIQAIFYRLLNRRAVPVVCALFKDALVVTRGCATGVELRLGLLLCSECLALSSHRIRASGSCFSSSSGRCGICGNRLGSASICRSSCSCRLSGGALSSRGWCGFCDSCGWCCFVLQLTSLDKALISVAHCGKGEQGKNPRW